MDQPQPPTPKRQGKKWEDMSGGEKFVGMTVFILVVLGAFWLFWSFLGHSDGTTADNTASQTQAAPQSPAYTLAELELNHAPDSATVAQYQSALDRLKPLCKEDESKIANEIWNSLQDLKKNNVNDETSITFAGHIVSSIPPSAAPTNCAGVMAAYLSLREPASQ